jgi:hypothetical protein
MVRGSLVLGLVLMAGPLLANDGFGGFSATGLTFANTEAVAMESEDLYISKDKVRVSYEFRNLTDSDVTGEVIFPMPPLSLWGTLESMWNLPEDLTQENLLNFRAVVDGVEVPVSIDRIAVIEPPWEENRPSNFQYDTPGRDVTADLARLGIPLSINAVEISEMLLALDPATKDEMVRLDLAEFYPAADGMPEAAFPHWSVILRYHWTQTFPAGSVVKIEHDYDNRPAGGLFAWEDPVPDYMETVRDLYCVDEGTSRALAKLLAQKMEDGATYSMGESWNIQYVLRTANSWAGPIKRFRLTIDKSEPENIVSLCADGITKTGPTTFVMEKTDFVPDRDLDILVVKKITYE